MIHEFNLINEKIHFDDLNRKIKKEQYAAISAGMFGSGPYLIIISDILLNDLVEYFKKIYDILFNEIKSKKHAQLKSEEFIQIIRVKTQNILEKYMEILNREANMNASFNPSRQKIIERMFKSLMFSEKFEEKLKILCHEYESNYSEYLQKKTIEKISLEANKSSISSKRAAWAAIFISVSGINLPWIFQHIYKFYHP